LAEIEGDAMRSAGQNVVLSELVEFTPDQDFGDGQLLVRIKVESPVRRALCKFNYCL
jgi:hypothetical protein